MKSYVSQEEAGWVMKILAVALCLIGLVYVWAPNNAELDSIRTNIVHAPPVGHWIYTEAELTEVHKKVTALQKRLRVQRDARDGYTGRQHFQDHEWLVKTEKSLLPYSGEVTMDSRGATYGVSRGGIRGMRFQTSPSALEGYVVTPRAASLLHHLRVALSETSTRDAFDAFYQQKNYTHEVEVFRGLMKESGLEGLAVRPIEEMDVHWGAFGSWFLITHIQSMFIVLVLFAIRAHLLGQSPWILFHFGHIEKTVFWMMFWPVGICVHPKNEVMQLIRIMRQRVAIAFSFLLTVAVPGIAKAQARAGDGKASAEHAQVAEAPKQPRNSVALAFEGVNRYVGPFVVETFAEGAAPRVMATYARQTDAGTFHLDSWNSVGTGFHNEADLGAGFSRKGWDVSITHFFVRGGDIVQAALSKAGSVPLGSKKLSLGATLYHFRGIGKTSPPGGTVGRFTAGFSHSVRGLGNKLSITHNVALGVDDNPFGLGDGVTATAAYGVEVGYKGAYVGWFGGSAVAGRDNTARGFRQNFSAGFRHQFAW
jgi:hypothetical protein